MSESGQGNDYFVPIEGIGGIFERVFHVFGKAWVPLICVYFITNLASIGLSLLTLAFFIGTAYHQFGNEYYYNDDESNNMYGDDVFGSQYSSSGSNRAYSDTAGIAFLFFMITELVIVYSMQSIGDGASVFAAVSVYAGDSPTILGCFRAACRKFTTLFAAALSVGFGLLLVPLFLIILIMVVVVTTSGGDPTPWLFVLVPFAIIYFIYIAIETFLVYPTIMVESCGPWQAISRSFHLVKDNFGEIFCTLFLWGFVKAIVNGIVSSSHAGQNNAISTDNSGGVRYDVNLGGAGDGFASFAIGVLFAAIGSVFQAVIYINIRVKKESMSRATLLQEMDLAADANNNAGQDARYVEMGNPNQHYPKEPGTTAIV
uniref:Uncharacterized protein n=1 Tax=Amphora coffeiformis TaxID=265554 RepID=A0A7S3KY81_9STRA|eukprot:scaffold6925_cov180-Amphora_coffeaeformis.AAC.4